MKRASVFLIILLGIALTGCTLEEPRAIGEKCDEVAFLWPDEAGAVIKPGDSDTYDYYLNNRICPPDKPYCLTKKGFVHRGTVGENGEYLGDVVYPDEWYCSDRKESCPKNSHLVTEGERIYCEQDSALHCGSADNNCMDSAKGVESAECEDGKCSVGKCLPAFALVDGECRSGAQCCGDYCVDCTHATDARNTCSTDDDMAYVCDTACGRSDMIDCNGVCVNPNTNIAFCGVTADENGECGMHYCPDMDGWRDGACIKGVCQVSECLLGYHTVVDDDGSRRCERDTAEVCGFEKKDCTQIAHAETVMCELGQCIVKSCDAGYWLYDNTCVEYSGEHCGGGVECGPHQFCDPESLECKCEPEYTDCNGLCYDLNTNQNHCGDCSISCTVDGIRHASDVSCTDGVCAATECAAGYHLYQNGCEKDDLKNCGAHDAACDNSVIAGGSAFDCSTGSCVATACAGGYQKSGDSCVVCDANLSVFVSRTTKMIDSSTEIGSASTIVLHYKRRIPGETDPNGHPRYKVNFSQPGRNIDHEWMYADYVNVLVDVKRTVKTDWPGPYVDMPAGCVDPAYGKARLYNTEKCEDNTIEKCFYNITCFDGGERKTWGFFDYRDDRSAFDFYFMDSFADIPEC